MSLALVAGMVEPRYRNVCMITIVTLRRLETYESTNTGLFHYIHILLLIIG